MNNLEGGGKGLGQVFCCNAREKGVGGRGGQVGVVAVGVRARSKPGARRKAGIVAGCMGRRQRSRSRRKTGIVPVGVGPWIQCGIVSVRVRIVSVRVRIVAVGRKDRNQNGRLAAQHKVQNNACDDEDSYHNEGNPGLLYHSNEDATFLSFRVLSLGSSTALRPKRLGRSASTLRTGRDEHGDGDDTSNHEHDNDADNNGHIVGDTCGNIHSTPVNTFYAAFRTRSRKTREGPQSNAATCSFPVMK